MAAVAPEGIRGGKAGPRGYTACQPLSNQVLAGESACPSELRSDGKLKHAPPMRRRRLEMARLQWQAKESACPTYSRSIRSNRIDSLGAASAWPPKRSAL